MRVMLLYIMPILIKVSPFVQVFSISGLPGAADIMNFVLLTAVLLTANSGIYATSRTMFSLSQNGEAPKVFALSAIYLVLIFNKENIIGSFVCLVTLSVLFLLSSIIKQKKTELK